MSDIRDILELEQPGLYPPTKEAIVSGIKVSYSHSIYYLNDTYLQSFASNREHQTAIHVLSEPETRIFDG